MLGSPYRFAVINFACFAIGLLIAGFNASIFIAIFMCIFIIMYNRKKIGLENSMALAISYLMIFDAETYSYTPLKLRIWYILLIPLLILKLKQHNFFIKQPKNLNSLIFIFFGVSITMRLITDPIDGKLSIIKYLIFSLGAIFVLKESFRSIAKITGLKQLTEYFVSLAIFVGTWGIFQFFANILGMGSSFQADYYNVRPSAFFSETTWYAEYLVFGLVFAYYNFQTSNKNSYLLLMPIFLIGIILSVTRNAFLAIAMWIFTTFVLSLLRTKIKPIHPLMLISILIGMGIIIYYSSNFDFIVNLLKNKLSLTDSSAQGRLDAIQVSISRILKNPIFGHGFGFNQITDTIAESGTSIGAKHANLFLMIAYIFGIPGLILLLYTITNFIVRQSYKWINSANHESKYAVILLIIYLSISMFAPLHQYPCGMYIIAATLLLSTPKLTSKI